MTQSLRPYSALALARALKNQYPQHHGAVRSFSSYNHIMTWFQDWFKDSTSAGFNKQQHKILIAKESDYSKRSRETLQPEKRPNRQNQEFQSEQKLPHLPYPGYAHRSSNSSRSSIDWRKDLTGGSKEPPDKIHAAEKSDAVGLKNKALEKTQKQCRSPTVSKQPAQVDHVTESTSTISNKPTGEICSACKSNDLQGTTTPEKSQESAQPPRQATQQPHYEHKLHHLPYHGGVSSWRTSTDKCGLFCQCYDSITVGITKPKDNRVDTKKDLQADKTTKDMLAPDKSPSETTQQPHSEHKNVPHQGAVSDWRTCNDKCGMFCQWNESLAGVFTKPKDETSISMKNNVLQGETPKDMLKPDKSTTDTTHQPHPDHVLQHLPHHDTVNSWSTCSDKCELFCQCNDFLTRGMPKPKDEICVDTKNNDLQADKKKHMLGPDNSPCETTQQTLYEHKLQRRPHQAAVSDWRTCCDKCGLFCQWNDSLAGVFTKPKDEISISKKTNDLHGDKTPKDMLRSDKSTTETTQQLHSEHKLQHLPHHGGVSDWRTCSNKCELFCQCNDSITGAITKLKDGIPVDTINKVLQADKTKDILGSDKSPNETTQQPHFEHKNEPHQGAVSDWRTCNDKCAIFCQWNESLAGVFTKPKDKTSISMKNNVLQGETPKDMLQPDKSTTDTTHQPHPDLVLQHLPHQGAVSDCRTCSDKCELFCQCNDFLTGGMPKQTEKIRAARKSDEPGGEEALENSQEQSKSLSEVKLQTQNDHNIQHLPHHGAVCSWPTCNERKGLSCERDASFSESNKAPDEILADMCSDDLEGGAATEMTKEAALTQTKQPPPTGEVTMHSKSQSQPKRSISDSAQQSLRVFDDWEPPPNEWRIKLYAMNMAAKSAEKASEKTRQPPRSSYQLTQAPKNQHANEPYPGELVTQFPNYVHMLLRTRSETWNLARRTTSVSPLRQTHSYGGWDQPPNKLRITPYAQKSGSTPGGKSPDKPGAKAPDKPEDKTPEKSERPKRRFSRHVEMLLGRTSIGKKIKERVKKKDSKSKGEGTSKSKGEETSKSKGEETSKSKGEETSKSKGEETSKSKGEGTSKSGSLPGKGGKK